MAVVAIKSQPVTDLDATPVVKQAPRLHGGKIREVRGFVTTNSDDSIASIYRMCRVPSNAVVSSVLGSHDVGSASAGKADVGLYQTAANGGAVVDVDYFAAAWDFNAAGDVANVELVHQTAAGASFLVNDTEKRIWQVLGLTADPNIEYDVALTLTEAVATAACELSLKVRYVLDN